MGNKKQKKINQYLQICPLGEGSFAKVFLGMDSNECELFAMKRVNLKGLARTMSGIKQLEREIETMRQLQHPNLVSLREVIHVKETSTAYIILDYCDCGSLYAALEKQIIFSPEQIRSIFKQVVEGVAYIHSHGIVHQDLKPSNILLCSNGNALISDFGIGHSFQSAAMVVGTPAYQAPEVIDDNFITAEYAPGKEDIWSLGVTLYQLVFNELPFNGENVFEIVRSIAMTTLEPPKSVDPDLWDLISGMLAIDPNNRVDIQQVIEHKYVSCAESTEFPQIQPFEVPWIDYSLPMEEVQGSICDDGYSFADNDTSLKKKLNSFQSPFSQNMTNPFIGVVWQ